MNIKFEIKCSTNGKTYYVFDQEKVKHVAIAADGSVLSLRDWMEMTPIQLRSVGVMLQHLVNQVRLISL